MEIPTSYENWLLRWLTIDGPEIADLVTTSAFVVDRFRRFRTEAITPFQNRLRCGCRRGTMTNASLPEFNRAS